MLFGSCRTVSSPPEASPERAATPTLALSPGKSIGLRKSERVPKCIIEKINDTWSPQIKQPVPVPYGQSVTVTGWAVDEERRSVAGGVDVVVDGMPYRARYGLARDDVAAYLGFPGCKNSGFTLTVPPSKLVEKGLHHVALRVLANDGTFFYNSAALAIELR